MQPYDIPLLASAARTANTSSDIQTNPGFAGVYLMLEITAASGTGGLIPQIRFHDPVSGTTKLITSIPLPVKATGNYVYAFHPQAAEENTSLQYAAPLRLPLQWSVTVTHDDGSSYTYSLSASYLGGG